MPGRQPFMGHLDYWMREWLPGHSVPLNFPCVRPCPEPLTNLSPLRGACLHAAAVQPAVSRKLATLTLAASMGRAKNPVVHDAEGGA